MVERARLAPCSGDGELKLWIVLLRLMPPLLGDAVRPFPFPSSWRREVPSGERTGVDGERSTPSAREFCLCAGAGVDVNVAGVLIDEVSNDASATGDMNSGRVSGTSMDGGVSGAVLRV